MTNKIPTQTFTFNRDEQEPFFADNLSKWNFQKELLNRAIELAEFDSDEDFEIIIKSKNN